MTAHEGGGHTWQYADFVDVYKDPPVLKKKHWYSPDPNAWSFATFDYRLLKFVCECGASKEVREVE